MDLIFTLLIHLGILIHLKILSLKANDSDAITENKDFDEKWSVDYFIVIIKDLGIEIYFKRSCDDFFFVITAVKEFAANLKFEFITFKNY